MLYYIKLYIPTLLAFLAIDAVWLGFIARAFYRKHIGFLLADQPNWWAAGAFYLIFVAGMVVFVVAPAVESGSIWKAVLLGAFFGLVTYATFDFTNHAIVKDWPWIVTVVDLCWGAFLAGSVCTIAYLAGRWLTAS